jgi:hypothetical protein
MVMLPFCIIPDANPRNHPKDIMEQQVVKIGPGRVAQTVAQIDRKLTPGYWAAIARMDPAELHSLGASE